MTDLISPHWTDYALLDSGASHKLEQFGPYRFIRPETGAPWPQALSRGEWARAHGEFSLGENRWVFSQPVELRWTMRYKALTFFAQPTPYRHLGVFPEQAAHWDWLGAKISQAQRPVRVLNLFGYTGLATLAAAAAGAHVTHVDASRKAVAWARENAALSALQDRPIRWIVDDVMKYVRREVKRGAHYDGFIMDPPPFGHGPKGEVWKFDDSLPALLALCRDLLSEQPLFVVITAYTSRTSVPALGSHLLTMMDGCGGAVSAGRAVLMERSAGRKIPLAFYARWAAQASLPNT